MHNTPRIVNDFCITFSTINGSGSATANTTILRALFKMGIPVAGKNIFPSNIQGLPTWYAIRISSRGYLARLAKDDIVVAMNPMTIINELEYINPGGVLFYSDDIVLPESRNDVIKYPMPVKKIMKDSQIPSNLRDFVANMVYVGVVAQMLGINMDAIRQALDFHFKGKDNAIVSNYSVIGTAAKWAEENLEKNDPYFVEPMHGTEGFIMADGNMAGALGAIYGGVQFTAWYPITPASSLAESINEYLPILRKNPDTNTINCAVVQSEDELAAIGMTIGAGWAGLRSMTSTSGPGLSLMTEYMGLAYYAEVPIVVWDVQRVGPSTGLPTRTAQGDITSTFFMSHGDSEMIMLFPGSVQECFEFGWRAFDIAERMQMPVMVMSDLDLGMNQWMTKKFEYPDKPMDRGKILWEKDLDEMLAIHNNQWGRYLDVDGDGITYRTVAGNRNPHSAYFSRGTGHDEFGKYCEEPEIWERVMDRLKRKYITAKKYVPNPVVCSVEGAKIGLIGYGSCDPAIEEARDLLALESYKTDYLRIRAMPFHDEIKDFIISHERVYVIEMNRDGQMKQLLTIEFPDLATKLIKASHLDGLPLTASWIKEQVFLSEGRLHD